MFAVQDVQSLPLLRGTHQVEQAIKEGILQRSEIRETHTFRPFSGQDSGATTTTRQLLKFHSERPAETINMGTWVLVQQMNESMSGNTFLPTLKYSIHFQCSISVVQQFT